MSSVSWQMADFGSSGVEAILTFYLCLHGLVFN
jgi:hypothetical protein